MGAHRDPHYQGKHPELKDKAIVPDILLQPHNATLQMRFSQESNFQRTTRGISLPPNMGSWSVLVGYEVIRIPLHQTGQASGEYEAFLTGFVLPDGRIWGRPVGITVARGGSLLVDDGSNSIWRITNSGQNENSDKR